MRKHVTLPYGESHIGIVVEADRFGGVYSPNAAEALNDPAAALHGELRNDYCSRFLRDITARAASSKHLKTVIVINDYTRFTPVRFVLPSLLDELNRCGIPDGSITIVVALGTHRPETEAEFITAAGEQVLNRMGFVNPLIDEPDRLVSFGRTASGVEVCINRDYVEADIRIAVGSIIPHGAVGFSGGAKLMYPGIAGRKTIEQFHLAANGNALNYTGNLESPIRLEIEKLAGMVGLDLLVNLVLNAEGDIAHITAGHFVTAHRRGADLSRRIYGVALASEARIMVASSFHADTDFWQAAKCVFNCQAVVANGGWLIVVTPCPEGIPPEHASYDKFIGMSSEVLREKIEKKQVPDLITAAPAMCMARFRERINIGIVSSGLTAKQVARMGFHHFVSVEEAIEAAIRSVGQSKIAFVTHGGVTFPYVE